MFLKVIDPFLVRILDVFLKSQQGWSLSFNTKHSNVTSMPSAGSLAQSYDLGVG